MWLQIIDDFGDRADEAITSPGQRLYPVLTSGRLRQRTADRQDLHRQVALFDDDADHAASRMRSLRTYSFGCLTSAVSRPRASAMAEHACLGVEAERPDIIARSWSFLERQATGFVFAHLRALGEQAVELSRRELFAQQGLQPAASTRFVGLA